MIYSDQPVGTQKKHKKGSFHFLTIAQTCVIVFVTHPIISDHCFSPLVAFPLQIQQKVLSSMIMYLAQGEPSYLPDGLFAPARDEAHPDLARFLQRHANRPKTWTVAAFMAENTGWFSHADIAAQLALSASIVITHLGALVESGFVEERMLITGPSYRFAANYRMRAFFKLWAPTLQCEQ